jgi:hypothetical protein
LTASILSVNLGGVNIKARLERASEKGELPVKNQGELLMKNNEGYEGFGFLRQLCLVGTLLGLTLFAGALLSAAQSPRGAQNRQPAASAADPYTTTVDYVTRFYPLWFTYYQFNVDGLLQTTNCMVAPDKVTSLYHFVVAINADTLYSSVYFDLRNEPVLVTIPPAGDVQYSILVLDPYGNEIETGIQPQTSGVYAFTGPGYAGTLPPEAIKIPMSINFPSLYVRTVKFNELEKAEQFRASLKSQTLSKYRIDPNGGPTKILPEAIFAVSFKLAADTGIARLPIIFLKSLQMAVAAPNTPTLPEPDQKLSDDFNALFGNGNTQQSEFSAGARKAHELILDAYLEHTGATNWIHFTNIGDWGENYAERSAITEFLQLGNSISTAAYYHTFSDGSGQPLDASNQRVYILKFTKDQIPEAQRFWSLTAYTPNAIELVPGTDKYVVASYTPDLQYDAVDGSLTVYMSAEQPAGVPAANWLPVPSGKFNIILRVYGPTGDVADNTYVPPAIN